jgi:hypothetical protein
MVAPQVWLHSARDGRIGTRYRLGMPTSPHFDPSALEMLGRVREVRIETMSLDGARTHGTIVWVVTAGDQAYVRSVNGVGARWYREALGHPDVVLHVEGDDVPVTAVPANDPDSIQRVSDAFRAKYGKRSPASTEMMVQPHNLEATLRLEPRGTRT